jgi:2'-5' RNA ligase
VERHERLRLFVALLLPDSAVSDLVEWQRREVVLANGRIVPPENLHVTVAFIGARPAEELESITAAVRAAAGESSKPLLAPVRYRETRSVGMIVFSDEGARAAALAARVFGGLERLAVYKRERREWLPHVTVARFRERPRLDPSLPPLGPVVSSEIAVMISRLRPSGAEYEVVESIPLGG